VVLDLFTRKVVGSAMREHMRAELTITTLIMAIQRPGAGAGLIHYSDGGSQYVASEYRGVVQAAAITLSMSRKANCWDNAPMESFFRHSENRAGPPPRIPRSRYCAARPVRLYRRLLQSCADPFRHRLHHPDSRQRQKTHNPVSTFPREGHELSERPQLESRRRHSRSQLRGLRPPAEPDARAAVPIRIDQLNSGVRSSSSAFASLSSGVSKPSVNQP